MALCTNTPAVGLRQSCMASSSYPVQRRECFYFSRAYPADARAECQDEKQQTKRAQNETDVIRHHVTF